MCGEPMPRIGKSDNAAQTSHVAEDLNLPSSRTTMDHVKNGGVPVFADGRIVSRFLKVKKETLLVI